MTEYSKLLGARKDWAMSPWRLASEPLPIPTTPFGTYKAGRGGWPSWARDYKAPSYKNKEGVEYPSAPLGTKWPERVKYTGRKYWMTGIRNFTLKRRNARGK